MSGYFLPFFKIKRFVLQFNCKYMQDVHITCILILEFMRKTPAFEFSTFSICIILQTVCIICLNNSSCSFQDTKLFQFSCTDSQHRDKHHTLIFDNYEKKAWLQLFRFGSAYGSVYYFRITDNVHTKENSVCCPIDSFPSFFLYLRGEYPIFSK